MARRGPGNSRFSVEIAGLRNYIGFEEDGPGMAHGAPPDGPRQERAMFSVVGLLGAGAGSALVIWGTMVRRALERSGLARGAGRMPAGAAQEAS